MNSTRPLPIWRSLLFVPVNVPRFVEKAVTIEVDAIQLDLEDSIPLDEKDHARTLVENVAIRVGASGADVVVRINRPIGMAVRDIEASVCPAVTALALPKVSGPDHIRLLSEHVSEIEMRRGLPEGHTRFIAMVESADAMFDLREIARADPRVVAITLGGEDFATSAGIEPEPEGLLLPKQLTVFAAAAAGILPLGFVGSIAEFKDIERFRAIIRRSKRLGFRGAACIHPAQVKVLNEEFQPSPEELSWARRAVDTYAAARLEGRGSVTLDGRMIDVPIIQRAEAILAWSAALQARTERVISMNKAGR
jgi:citrate lyase subunit beta / citryl-CoA lyase